MAIHGIVFIFLCAAVLEKPWARVAGGRLYPVIWEMDIYSYN
jgi:hypothetical protein